MAYHILADGSIKRIGPADWDTTNSVSPDQNWFFIYERDTSNERPDLSLYNNTYKKISSWTFKEDVIATSWRPDSLGVFLFTEKNIYYLSIPDGNSQLLEVEVPPWSVEGCDPIICTWPELAWRP